MLVAAPSRLALYALSLLAGATVFFLIAAVSHAPPTPHNSWKAISSIVTDANANSAHPTTRIGRLTASFDDGENELAARMLDLQTKHAEKWNYPMHTLHRELLSSQWTKPAWIMSIMVAECAKPPEERLEWLFWSDADVVVSNLAMPLHVFLPPATRAFADIQLIISEDNLMINSGVFFLRVGPWALQFLADILAYETYTGEWHPGSELNYHQGQSAMKYVMELSKNTESWLLVPQRWFNAYHGPRDYQNGMALTVPEAELDPGCWRVGDLQVHFPGGQRGWLGVWTDYIETNAKTITVPLEKTDWTTITRKFYAEAAKKKKQGLHDTLTTPQPPDS